MSEVQSSPVLPTDQFDKLLSKLIGLPNGSHVQPTVVQSVDYYGNVTSYMVQTVKTDEGPHVFLAVVNAQGSQRFILPPSVMRLIDRQRDTTTSLVRRRHGKRLAEERKANGAGGPVFTAEMREKARQTRMANAAKRRAQRAKKAARG